MHEWSLETHPQLVRFIPSEYRKTTEPRRLMCWAVQHTHGGYQPVSKYDLVSD